MKGKSNTVSDCKTTSANEEWTKGYHGTRFEGLGRILVHGLENSSAEYEEDGITVRFPAVVYFHQEKHAHKCLGYGRAASISQHLPSFPVVPIIEAFLPRGKEKKAPYSGWNWSKSSDK